MSIPQAGSGSRRSVTLQEFDAILELLASDPRGPENASDTAYPEWVRRSVSAGGTKLRVLRYMLDHAPSPHPRLLDVGAQVGAMAAYASKLGFEVAAVDYPHYARRFSQILAPCGLDYRSCDISHQPLPFSDGAFEFVTYMDVIEHHSFSPKRVLLEIRRVLAPGGRVLITTPNHASLYNRLLLLLGRSVNDDFAYHFNTCEARTPYPGHHREYTRRELRMALQQTGFRVLECATTEESVGSQLYALRKQKRTLAHWTAHEAFNVLATAAGNLWGALALPFGRLLWAVGQKDGPGPAGGARTEEKSGA